MRVPQLTLLFFVALSVAGVHFENRVALEANKKTVLRP